MRLNQLLLLSRFLGVSALGTVSGLAVGGLITVVTGQAFAIGTDWPKALPGLLVLGAAVGALASRSSRRWLFPISNDKPRVRRRLLLFAAAGAIVVPLAVAAGQSDGVAPLVLAPAAACWATTLVIWIRHVRREQRTIRRAIQVSISAR